MTSGQIGRTCTFGTFLGLIAALLVRWIWILRGLSEPWILMAICVVLGIILWVAFRVTQERVLSKDYRKVVEARRRRIH